MSAKAVRDLKSPGMYSVGGVPGLKLQIAPSGAKSWLLRVKVGDRRREIGLGGFPGVTLAEAREEARETRAKVRQGIDPVEERRAIRQRLKDEQARRLTFEQAFERVMANDGPSFSESHRKQWRRSVELHALPHIGSMPVDEIQMRHIEELLLADDFWREHNKTARDVRNRIERVLDWATAGGHREGDNPARLRGGLKERLPKLSKLDTAPKHYAALPIDLVPSFMADLRERGGMPARCLEFQILTGVRPNEARGALWSEIDFKAGTWTIPAGRMKAGREHRVALSKEALALLGGLPREPGELVFPGNSRRMIGINSTRTIIGRMHTERAKEQEAAGEEPTGYKDPKAGTIATPHGFRSSFRDFAGERTSYPVHVIEMALAHSVGDATQAAYARGDLLEKRRQLMDAWGKFCKEGEAAPAVVTPIRAQEG
ncbi:integrase arm-type DNA-binding domain-containing protein [Halomonas sp. PGE1]|nr:integrase arm-type DNA-binding domain-containing protein [Halomonas sp. PGE1]